MPAKYHTAGDVHHIKSIKTHVQYIYTFLAICHISTKQQIVKLSVVIIKSKKSMVVWDRTYHLSPECASLNLQPGRLPPGTAGSGEKR